MGIWGVILQVRDHSICFSLSICASFPLHFPQLNNQNANTTAFCASMPRGSRLLETWGCGLAGGVGDGTDGNIQGSRAYIQAGRQAWGFPHVFGPRQGEEKRIH